MGAKTLAPNPNIKAPTLTGPKDAQLFQDIILGVTVYGHDSYPLSLLRWHKNNNLLCQIDMLYMRSMQSKNWANDPSFRFINCREVGYVPFLFPTLIRHGALYLSVLYTTVISVTTNNVLRYCGPLLLKRIESVKEVFSSSIAVVVVVLLVVVVVQNMISRFHQISIRVNVIIAGALQTIDGGNKLEEVNIKVYLFSGCRTSNAGGVQAFE